MPFSRQVSTYLMAQCLHHQGHFWTLFLQNVCIYLQTYTASHQTRSKNTL